MREKAASFISPRIHEPHWNLKVLSEQIYCEVDKAVDEGYNTFYSACSTMLDIIAAEQVLMRSRVFKTGGPERVRLVLVNSSPAQIILRGDSWRIRYEDIREQCDETTTLYQHYSYYEQIGRASCRERV